MEKDRFEQAALRDRAEGRRPDGAGGVIGELALAGGRQFSYNPPLAGAALQLFLMTASAGMGRDDDASVARLYGKIAGLDLPGRAAP
jgi:hypothetical protein